MSSKVPVAIVMGSQSDEAIVQKAIEVFNEFKVSFKCFVMSAHRTPNRVRQFACNAEENGYKVIIAAAGLAAALPGVIAAHTTLPIIGIPIDAGTLRGQDALYSIVQMPPGIPVATVGINNAKNAAYLALEILGLSDKDISKSMKNFRKNQGDL
jgi:5-(carboxyamino)imidazole ribonucleotide mutase